MSYAVGTIVKICCKSKYDGYLDGEIGSIENYLDEREVVGVRVDGMVNHASAKGLFWFPIDAIEIIESEIEVMKAEKFVVAGIKFTSGTNTDREYYYALYDENIVVDDLVVVKTGHHGFGLAKISSIGKVNADLVECGREIVSKVDMTAYEDRVNRRESIKRVKSEMDAKVKELQSMAIYELLAKEDASLAALLKEYKDLLG